MALDALWQVAIALLGAGAVYGGIRADMRQHRADISEARRRIDSHIDAHLKGDLCALNQGRRSGL